MTVHLVIPGLLGPLPETDIAKHLAGFSSIRQCLSRADRMSWTAVDVRQTLFSLLNIDCESGQDLPTAAIALSGETSESADGWWMHADPVLLKADADQLLLFDAPRLDIQAAEAESLVTAFNDHFGCDGLHLQAPAVGRWYLSADVKSSLQTFPLTEVVGRNIDTWLPQGSDSIRWRQILNEVQMLFYHHPVNAAREAAGQPVISGLWFSGTGTLPSCQPCDINGLCGDDVLLRGMASYCDIPLVSVETCMTSDADSIMLLNKVQRTVLDAAPDVWSQQLADVDRLLATLMHEKKPFRLYPGGETTYCWRPAHRFRFWRTLPETL